METGKQNLTINIDRVIASKSSSLAKYTPKFIIRFMERVIHQDEINSILHNHPDKTGVEFAAAALQEMQVSYRAVFTNKESVLKKNNYIFASNHPMGGLDGLILINLFGKELGEIKFVVNDLLLNIKPLEPVFVPVNKLGRMSKEYGQIINQAYSSPCHILYFPAGLCSRMIQGAITDPLWHKNFLKQALKYNRDIVPVYFRGANSKFFYRLAKLRKFLKISFNLEMILLPHEMFRQKNSIFDVIIGEPISIESIRHDLTEGGNLQKWCDIIRTRCYELKNIEP